MLFNSLTFFALLLPTLAAYWLVPWQRVRLALLLAASLVFYSYFHWPSVFLLLFTISFNYGMGRRQARVRSRLELAAIIAVNLSLLLWFKYAGFIADNLNDALSLAGTPLARAAPAGLPAAGHFVLHVPGDRLSGGRLPRRDPGGAVVPALRGLQIVLPAADRRAHRAREGLPAAVARPDPVRSARCSITASGSCWRDWR